MSGQVKNVSKTKRKLSPKKSVSSVKTKVKPVKNTSEIKKTRKRKLDEMGCCSSKKEKVQVSKKVKTESEESIVDSRLSIANQRRYTLKSDWDNVDFIQDKLKAEFGKSVIKSVVSLIENGSTVPFIARYRKAQTGGLEPDILRRIKEENERAKTVKKKIETVLKNIDKCGKLTEDLAGEVKSLKTLSELEHIQSLYKVSSRKLLAESARELGLGGIAESIIKGEHIPHLKSLVNPDVDGLEDEQEVKQGIIYIIADVINKDKRVIDKAKELRDQVKIAIDCKAKSTSKKLNTNDKEDKYKIYYGRKLSVKVIEPYHVLAINRGESEKKLSLSVDIPSHFEVRLRDFVMDLYYSSAAASNFHSKIIRESFDYAYKKSIRPAVIRRLRSELTEIAHEKSMECFAINVKNLLLTKPVRGQVILGVDPGFFHGCKLAIISEQGDLLETSTIYPHSEVNYDKKRRDAADTLAILVRKHNVTLIALGNGKGCRETEIFIADLIKDNFFRDRDISYTIVNEAGASENSIKSELQSEFPKLDCNLISAVSIARKLQDPLAELVKYDPKSMGVGMYQHDLASKELDEKLNEVISEVVSLVGVDINTASRSLLRRVAGLTDARAVNIIEHRKTKGTFRNRMQLLDVKGIGTKVFEQCAGFIRILPTTASVSDKINKSKDFNYLDQTWIHPESYEIANAFIDACNVDLKHLGTREFISAVNIFAGQGYPKLAAMFKTDECTLEIIKKGLTMKEDDDIRLNGDTPVFRKSIMKIDDLTEGLILTGDVRNVTDFGVFVDIGVGKYGMIYNKKLNDELLTVGNRVEVKVESINKSNQRIGLVLIRKY